MSSRRLASPDDVIAALRAASQPQIQSRLWPGIRVVEISLGASGQAQLPPAAFYSLWTVAGSAARMFERRNGVQQSTIVAEPRTLVLRGPGHGYEYEWEADHLATLTCLDAYLVRAAAVDCGLTDPDRVEIEGAVYARDPMCEHLVTVLREEARVAAHPGQPLMVQSVASALALRLVTRFAASGRPTPSEPGALTGRTFERIRAYVEHNIGEPISLPDLACVAGVSRFHFARLFRRRTGESPMGYVVRSRIERAKLLLLAGEQKIADIAAALGFADQSHFTRTFRRLVGMSPSEFGRSRTEEWDRATA